MVTDVSPTLTRTRTVAEAAAQRLERWWQLGAQRLTAGTAGDARFYLGRARRALDHGDVAAASREASKALSLDDTSPWPLITLARCALAQGRPRDAVELLLRAQARAPRNGYVTSLLTAARMRAREVVR